MWPSGSPSFSMENEVVSWAPEEAPGALADLGPWDVLIVSGREIEEARACWGREHLAGVPRIHILRHDEDEPHQFVVGAGEGQEERVDWLSLGAWLEQHLSAGRRVLIDMNLLAFDTLLYLLPALRSCRLDKLACLYVAPANYTFPERALTDQKLHPIEQPKGYVSLALDPDRQGARHLVFLGFDKARAWKFIDRYDWKEEHLYVVVADPPFVPEGVARARAAASPWLEDFERGFANQVQSVSAVDPAAVAAFCLAHFRQARWLDLAPLGPKPMNLGILWFYFGLSERDRGRVRLLYDFPVQQMPRSSGVGRVHFYDCQRLLA